jgi:hypothetical protein
MLDFVPVAKLATGLLAAAPIRTARTGHSTGPVV